MLRRTRLSVFACSLALTALGCSGSPDSPSSSSTLTGTWSGIVSAFGSPAGPGGLQATIAQNGALLTGTWGTAYPNPIFNDSGSLTGLASGTAVSLTLLSSIPSACPYIVTAIVVNPTTIQGTFATFNCSVAQSGTFNLGKH